MAPRFRGAQYTYPAVPKVQGAPRGAPRHPGWKPAPTTSPDLQGTLHRQGPQLIFVCASDRVVPVSPGRLWELRGGGIFLPLNQLLAANMGLTVPYEIHSPAQCPALPSRKAQRVPHGLIAWGHNVLCAGRSGRGGKGVLPQAIIPALAAFQELQKAQAGLLTSATLCCGCRQTYGLIFFFLPFSFV